MDEMAKRELLERYKELYWPGPVGERLAGRNKGMRDLLQTIGVLEKDIERVDDEKRQEVDGLLKELAEGKRRKRLAM